MAGLRETMHSCVLAFNLFLLCQVGNVPANAAYFGGYELGKAIVPGEAEVVDCW